MNKKGKPIIESKRNCHFFETPVFKQNLPEIGGAQLLPKWRKKNTNSLGLILSHRKQKKSLGRFEMFGSISVIHQNSSPNVTIKCRKTTEK